MKKFLLILPYMLMLKIITAQPTASENRLLKYYYYKHRLQTDFLLGVGDQSGMSIIADRRDYNNPLSSWFFVHWGDATISQSYYIASLALEANAQLNKYGTISPALLDELFYAIETINRLDVNGEIAYGHPGVLNGFFVRDDAGKGIIQSNGNLNWNLWNPFKDALNTNPPSYHIDDFASEWRQFAIDQNRGLEMSKDQIIHLYYAFAIVKSCIPPNILCIPPYTNNTHYFSGTSSSSYNYVVGLIAKRILDYVHDPSSPNSVSDWDIYNPDGIPVHQGYNAWTLAYGYSKTYERLTNFQYQNPILSWPHFNWDLAKKTFKLAFKYYYQTFMVKPGEGWKVLALTANSNCCGANSSIINFYANIFNNTMFDNNANYHVPPFYELVSGGNDNTATSWYESLFDRAPCYGPYNNNNGVYHDWDWSSSSITVHPERRGDNPAGFPGEYNGVDYMLLYSFYARRYGLDMKYDNLYDYTEKYDFPHQFPSFILGNDNNPQHILALHDVYDSRIIYPTGNANYRAGHEINLLAGFDAQIGSEFDGTVKEYECASGDDFTRHSPISSTIIETKTNTTINRLKLNATVFPVPFSTKINFQMSNLEKGSLKIKVIDVYGKTLKEITENYSDDSPATLRTVEALNLAPGYYTLYIQKNNQSFSRQIIKIN